MKRILTLFAVALLCANCIIMHAQTIRKGDKFWDGLSLWTVNDIFGGVTVYMTSGDGGVASLEVVNAQKGEYKLVPSSQADEPRFCGQFGWRVQYIRKEGMNFLAVRKPNGDITYVLTLTPDNQENCERQQADIERELPSEILQTTLLNRCYLSKIPNKKELRLMRNEILARHGYRFQSKDLQEWFGQQFWYKPGKDNSAIRLSIIEQTNVQLIKSEEEDRNE